MAFKQEIDRDVTTAGAVGAARSTASPFFPGAGIPAWHAASDFLEEGLSTLGFPGEHAGAEQSPRHAGADASLNAAARTR